MTIRKIVVINPQNGEKIRFLDSVEWQLKHGKDTCSKTDMMIARDFNDFKLLLNAEIGFYGLPQNNLVTTAGINQDGQDLYFNYYSSRQLLFKAKVFKELMTAIDIVLAQNDNVLTMQVYNQNAEYVEINVSCLGRYENGDFEFVSTENVFFRSPTESVIDFIIDQGSTGKFFFPFNPKSIYFKSAIPNNQVTIVSPSASVAKITISGTFQNMKITNLLNGDIFKFTGIVNSILEINAKDLIVKADGVQVAEANVSGVYPNLVAGTNIFLFEQNTAIYPLYGKVYYKEQFGSVL